MKQAQKFDFSKKQVYFCKLHSISEMKKVEVSKVFKDI